jgi:hypothetical protein
MVGFEAEFLGGLIVDHAFFYSGGNKGEPEMTLGTILLIILILIVLGSIPTWPYSRGWGYGPSGIVGIILVIVIILILVGRI